MTTPIASTNLAINANIRELLVQNRLPSMAPKASEAQQTNETEIADVDAISGEDETKKAFNQFVGETFFGMMVKSMRDSLGKSKYFHGGQAEEVFQSQLDQTLVEKISEDSAAQFSEPMYELFNLPRS